MSYTKTEWKTGDIITAERMNKLEEGVSRLSEEIRDLKENGTGTTVTSGSVKTILSNIMTIMRAQINPMELHRFMIQIFQPLRI